MYELFGSQEINTDRYFVNCINTNGFVISAFHCIFLCALCCLSHLLISYAATFQSCTFHVRGGADKSLARPETEEATAIKLGIYSTYSPRSCRSQLYRVIHYLWTLLQDIIIIIIIIEFSLGGSSP